MDKKKLCLVFQLHQPFRLKRYRFFDIGNDHYYFDDFLNEQYMRSAAERSYLPANQMIYDLIQQTKGKVKVAFAISGTALDQIEMYTPELIDSFRKLTETGCVELLAEPYAHSLSSLAPSKAEFKGQVGMHVTALKAIFNYEPKVLRNTELLYDDDIALAVAEMGFHGMLTEGAKHVLGWKSPDFVYQSAVVPELHLLMRHAALSEDLSRRFCDQSWDEYPLTADKYASWLADRGKGEQVTYLDMSYDVLGNLCPASSGIFDFFRALPEYIDRAGLEMATPSEVFAQLQPEDEISVLDTISWSEEEKTTKSWLGNVLQQESFGKLVEWTERTRMSGNRRIKQDWTYLQSSDHFLYMSTDMENKDSGLYSPYTSPYDAFNNYMNVLSDFHLRVEEEYPSSIENEELNALLKTIENQGEEITALQEELHKLRAEKPARRTGTTKKAK